MLIYLAFDSGVPRELHEKSVLSLSLSILPTTSWSVPTPSPSPVCKHYIVHITKADVSKPLSKSMPHHSDNGMRLTTAFP